MTETFTQIQCTLYTCNVFIVYIYFSTLVKTMLRLWRKGRRNLKNLMNTARVGSVEAMFPHTFL